MKTDASKTYRIRNKKTGRWLGTRKNGERYWKLWEGNSCEFSGGKKFDKALKKYPDCEAVEIKEGKGKS